MTIKQWLYVIIALVIMAFLASYFIPVLWLPIILIVLYLVFTNVRRFFVPKGHRIKHRMLKDYLTNKYGSDGKGVYKDIVASLRRRGYR